MPPLQHQYSIRPDFFFLQDPPVSAIKAVLSPQRISKRESCCPSISLLLSGMLKMHQLIMRYRYPMYPYHQSLTQAASVINNSKWLPCMKVQISHHCNWHCHGRFSKPAIVKYLLKVGFENCMTQSLVLLMPTYAEKEQFTIVLKLAAIHADVVCRSAIQAEVHSEISTANDRLIRPCITDLKTMERDAPNAELLQLISEFTEISNKIDEFPAPGGQVRSPNYLTIGHWPPLFWSHLHKFLTILLVHSQRFANKLHEIVIIEIETCDTYLCCLYHKLGSR